MYSCNTEMFAAEIKFRPITRKKICFWKTNILIAKSAEKNCPFMLDIDNMCVVLFALRLYVWLVCNYST